MKHFLIMLTVLIALWALVFIIGRFIWSWFK